MSIGVVVSCEHASNTVPPGIELGVDAAVLGGHQGWDPGALPVAQDLAVALGVPLLTGQVSRLVCDLHRREAHPEVMRVDAWGVAVPGNMDLSAAARTARLAAFHRPWRRGLMAEVDRVIAAHGRCVHLSIHSFTPVLNGEVRDLDVGVLFRPDRPAAAVVAAALVEGLRGAGLDAHPNRPYSGYGEATTTWLEERFDDGVYIGIEVELSHRLSTEALRGVTSALAQVTAGIAPGS